MNKAACLGFLANLLANPVMPNRPKTVTPILTVLPGRHLGWTRYPAAGQIWRWQTDPNTEFLESAEARVGIGRFTSVFSGKNMIFHQQMQATLSLPGRTITYPLTEGFTEAFPEGFRYS
jgi:hypothetical protein